MCVRVVGVTLSNVEVKIRNPDAKGDVRSSLSHTSFSHLHSNCLFVV